MTERLTPRLSEMSPLRITLKAVPVSKEERSAFTVVPPPCEGLWRRAVSEVRGVVFVFHNRMLA